MRAKWLVILGVVVVSGSTLKGGVFHLQKSCEVKKEIPLQTLDFQSKLWLTESGRLWGDSCGVETRTLSWNQVGKPVLALAPGIVPKGAYQLVPAGGIPQGFRVLMLVVQDSMARQNVQFVLAPVDPAARAWALQIQGEGEMEAWLGGRQELFVASKNPRQGLLEFFDPKASSVQMQDFTVQARLDMARSAVILEKKP